MAVAVAWSAGGGVAASGSRARSVASRSAAPPATELAAAFSPRVSAGAFAGISAAPAWPPPLPPASSVEGGAAPAPTVCAKGAGGTWPPICSAKTKANKRGNARKALVSPTEARCAQRTQRVPSATEVRAGGARRASRVARVRRAPTLASIASSRAALCSMARIAWSRRVCVCAMPCVCVTTAATCPLRLAIASSIFVIRSACGKAQGAARRGSRAASLQLGGQRGTARCRGEVPQQRVVRNTRARRPCGGGRRAAADKTGKKISPAALEKVMHAGSRVRGCAVLQAHPRARSAASLGLRPVLARIARFAGVQKTIPKFQARQDARRLTTLPASAAARRAASALEAAAWSMNVLRDEASPACAHRVGDKMV